MNFRRIFGISLCLNVILIAGSFWSGRQAYQRAKRDRDLSVSATGDEASGRARAKPLSAAKSRTQTPSAWSWVHSDDLPVFVRNLRVAGFDERIVQNVVVAEIDRLLGDGRVSAPGDANFWPNGPQRDASDRAHRRAERERELGRRARIKELLGVEWHETPSATIEESLSFLAFLDVEAPDGKEDRTSGLWARLKDRSKELRRADVLKTPEAEARRMQAYRETLDELRRDLGSKGLEELELRVMAMGVDDVWGSERLFGSVMTGQELRELLRIKKDETLPLADMFGVDALKPGPELTQSVNERIRALLGDERFGGYQRAQDPQFRSIHNALRGSNESMEMSWAVFDIYAGLKEAARQVRERTGSTEEQQRAALLELRTATERALETSMGSEKYAIHRDKSRGSFEWLDELTGKESGRK